MVTGHLEVERKYDVEADFLLPDPAELSTLGVAGADDPVEHELEAVYHDTADLRLTRARITLRRRTGGPDAGWHLKLPAGDGARREVHAPLGKAVTKPPRRVLDPVRGILRGAPTQPVATLRNHRTVTVLRDAGGRALAEVADDTVTASASGPDDAAQLQAWREVEIELVEGDERLLEPVGEWLQTAGARPSASVSKLARVLSSRVPAPSADPQWPDKRSTAGTAVLSVLRAEVSALQAADVSLRLDEPDAVHAVRVAARRLRSMVAAFREVVDRAATDPLRAELSWLGGELGQARDDEVALAHLADLLGDQPEELVLGPVAERLRQTALRATAEGRTRALATLDGARYRRLLDALHGLLDDPPLTPVAGRRARPVLRAAVHRTGKRLRSRLLDAQRAGEAERDGALHEVRKAAKRARYTAEVVAADTKSGARDVVRATKQVQQVLGAVQDTVVSRELCRRLGMEAAAAGENAFTFGLLHGLEAARAERERAAFAAVEPEVLTALRAARRS